MAFAIAITACIPAGLAAGVNLKIDIFSRWITGRLAAWLDMPIERVMHHANATAADQTPVVYYPHESTPEIVAAHLRADRHLAPETAKALSELFRVAYAQFSRSSDKPARKR